MNPENIFIACKQGNIELIKQALISNPSILNAKDFKVTIIQLGWSLLYRTVISGHLEATRFLLQQGAEVNSFTNFGETPLHQSADNSNYEISKLLLQHGADPNFQQNEGDTPLHFSAFRGDYEMMKLLLQNEGNPNIKNKVTGRTPLHYAVDCGYIECVKVMIESDADPFIKDNQSKTAFDLTQDSEMLKCLTSKNRWEENYAEEIQDLSQCGPEELFIERKSYSKDKLNELIKSIKCETTAVSTSKSTKQNKHELKPIFDWLDKINLTEYYEIMICEGYYSVDTLINDYQQLRLTIQNFIKKPGHYRKILFSVQEEKNASQVRVIRPAKLEKSIFKCCGANNEGTKGIYTFPTLKEKLKAINMEVFYDNFADAGYEDYENLVLMANSEFAIDYYILENELKIKEEKQIKRILKVIAADNLNFVGRRSMQIVFEDPKSVACESCGIF